jgi:hypothetical protein
LDSYGEQVDITRSRPPMELNSRHARVSEDQRWGGHSEIIIPDGPGYSADFAINAIPRSTAACPV